MGALCWVLPLEEEEEEEEEGLVEVELLDGTTCCCLGGLQPGDGLMLLVNSPGRLMEIDGFKKRGVVLNHGMNVINKYYTGSMISSCFLMCPFRLLL